MIRPPALLLGLLLIADGITRPCLAYDYELHRLVNQLALGALRPSFPEFVRTPAARERIAFLGGEPDRWRNTDELPLRHANSPDHFLDLEDLEPVGLQAADLPPFRHLFTARVFAARDAHPERFPPIDPGRNQDRIRELPGFLPWTIAEYYGRLESGFSYLRAFEEAGTPEEVANAVENILYVMGVMGHFVADGSQPLHTTRHYNGWVGENPLGFTTNRTFHSWIDGAFLERLGRPRAEPLQPRLRPAAPLWAVSRGTNSPVFPRIVEYLREQHRQVVPLYQLEKAGKLTEDPATSREGREFMEERLVTGAQMLADLWQTAFEQAGPDSFLKAQLARRKLNAPPTAKP